MNAVEEAALVAVEPEPELEADVDVEPGRTPREIVSAWAAEHSRGLLIALIVAALPYLIICNGMAILVVTGLLSSGCG